MPMNPTKLKPIEIVHIVNTTPLMAVLNDRQLRRHRDRAGFRISDDGGQTVNLFKYAAWLRSELMLRQSISPQTYEEKRNAARARNLALATAGRDIGELRSERKIAKKIFGCSAKRISRRPSRSHGRRIISRQSTESKRLFFAAVCSLWQCRAAPGRAR